MITARNLRKSFQVKGGATVEAVKGIDVTVSGRSGLRLPRTERRRQVLDHADDRLHLAPDRRRADASSVWIRTATACGSATGSGVVPQQDNLDEELTVRENLYIYGRYFGFGKKHCWAKADELLEFAQLTEKAKAKVTSLSGGMKRRLTIARSLVNDPDLLLLDEPTTGLDPQARHVLWDRLFRLKQQGVTLVLTTHYMDEAEQLCDRLVVMDGGLIVAEGSPAATHRGSYSTREVLELRFAPGDQHAAVPMVTGAGRADRGAARTGCCSTPPTVTPPRSRCMRSAFGRCPPWCGARRWRTCSCT